MTAIHFKRVLFLICPTGAYCREDRCQSFFDPKLIPSMRPPLEECESAAAVAALKAEALIIDAPALRIKEYEVLDRIRSFMPDLIILSVTFGSLDADLQWSRILKEKYPTVAIGLRGAPSYVWSQELLKNNISADFCLVGDYELVLKEILEKGIENANGVVFRDKTGAVVVRPKALASNLDELPLPDRSSLDSGLYRVRMLRARQATIHVQRGCPFPCTYCLVHTVSGKRARHRSVSSIVREVKILHEEGIDFIYFRAETFSVDRKWALDLCHALETHCPDIRWVTTTRVECVDDELLAAFRKAGCYGLSFGLDVGSQVIAKKVRKPLSKELALRAMRACDKHGILSLAYIMIGFLWDTKETLTEASHFIKEIRPDLLTVHFAHPYPGTPYYEAVKEANAQVVSLHAQAEPAINLQALSAEEIRRFGKRMLTLHYRRPMVIVSVSKKLTRLMLSAAFSSLLNKLPFMRSKEAQQVEGVLL